MDENIPLGREFFSALGEVVTKAGRNLSAADVVDADVLLVRSVTQVNEALLANSRVRFVGTCTIGTDHLDKTYLDRQGIRWRSAPGCNANSVTEYVFSCLACLHPHWLQATVGIIGCGNVGGRLYKKLTDLGVTCKVYDPLLTHEAIPDLDSLDVVLGCDVVCVHAPLTTDTEHPSFHLLGLTQLTKLKPGAVLISAGRGAVVDNQALSQLLDERADLKVALDVWEPEPLLDLALLDKVDIATPHIAGYSYDGKVLGTAMVYQALCDHLQRPEVIQLDALLDTELAPLHTLDSKLQDQLNQLVLQVYDAREDDRRLRDALLPLAGDESARASRFDELRKFYPERRGFHRYQVLTGGLDGGETTRTEKKPLSVRLAALGFCHSLLGSPSK